MRATRLLFCSVSSDTRTLLAQKLRPNETCVGSTLLFAICYFPTDSFRFPPPLYFLVRPSQDEPISPRNCILPPSLALKVRNDTTLLVRRARYRTKLGWFFGLSRLYKYMIPLRQTAKLWFGEPDTEPDWLVRMVWHDKLCRYVLTLLAIACVGRCSLHTPNFGQRWLPFLLRSRRKFEQLTRCVRLRQHERKEG